MKETEALRHPSLPTLARAKKLGSKAQFMRSSDLFFRHGREGPPRLADGLGKHHKG